MGGVIPLGDASRGPEGFPVVTTGFIIVNSVVFLLDLQKGQTALKETQ